MLEIESLQESGQVDPRVRGHLYVEPCESFASHNRGPYTEYGFRVSGSARMHKSLNLRALVEA